MTCTLFAGKAMIDGERKDNMDNITEETMLKVADYNNVERNFFSKRMCAMFALALMGMVIFAVIDILGLERTQPYETVVSTVFGFVSGTLVTGLLYASRYIVKLKASRMRLKKTAEIKAGIKRSF